MVVKTKGKNSLSEILHLNAKAIAGLSTEERVKVLSKLTLEEKAALYYRWEFWAREKQLPPAGNWYIWLILSGRGFGKTRVLSEMVKKWAGEKYSPIAIVCQTKADARDTMVEVGDSSILKVSPPWFMPEYEPSKRRLTWPNGVQALIYSGDEPDQLRGMSHQKAIVDELAKFQYGQETWDNLMMGVRLGDNPQTVIGTTPRPLPLLKDLVKDNRVVVTRGHTLENRDNLSPEFISYIMNKYQGTKLGRQELAGEILSSTEGLVYDAFKSDMCIIPRFALNPDWVRYFGMDFGRVNTAALWYAMEPATGFLYLYRTYLKKASVVEHAGNFRELSKGENIRRKVGGNHQEQEARDGYSLAGWPILEPKISNDRIERIRRVNSLHAQNKIYVFSDLNEYIDEKLSFSYEVDKTDNLTEKIHNESAFHLMCLVAGTMVTTDKGDKPIESIILGDRVLTRQGYHKVKMAGITGLNRDTFTAYFSNGATLTGTAAHGVYVQKRGFIPLTALRYNDIIETWKEKPLSIKEQGTIGILKPNAEATEYTSGQRRVISTVLCGKMPMVRYLLVGLFIIKMMTHLITNYLILSARVMANTCLTICRGMCMTLNTLLGYNLSVLQVGSDGQQPQKARQILVSDVSANGEIKCQSPKSVSIADLNIRQLNHLIVNSVQIDAGWHLDILIIRMMKLGNALFASGNFPSISIPGRKHAQESVVRCLGVKHSGKAIVYDLAVDAVHEYYANGILVHNSAESYILSEFEPDIGRKRKTDPVWYY